jgi:hypothetical protein
MRLFRVKRSELLRGTDHLDNINKLLESPNWRRYNQENKGNIDALSSCYGHINKYLMIPTIEDNVEKFIESADPEKNGPRCVIVV